MHKGMFACLFSCGVLFLIYLTKSTYVYYHPSFWPFQEKTKGKMQCFPVFGHSTFMKWEDHKVIKASSKGMAVFSNERFSCASKAHLNLSLSRV